MKDILEFCVELARSISFSLADESVPRPVLYPVKALEHNADQLFVCFREHHNEALLSNNCLDHKGSEYVEAYFRGQEVPCSVRFHFENAMDAY